MKNTNHIYHIISGFCLALILVFTTNACKDKEDASLSVSATEFSFDHSGGSQPLTIGVNVPWKARVEDSVKWCTISPSGGNKNSEGKLMVSVEPYTEAGPARTVNITFLTNDLAPQVVTVTQTSPVPTFEVSPVSLEFEGDGGAQTFSITSNMVWTVKVEDNKPWCTVDVEDGNGSATVKVTVGFASVGQNRDATITIKPGVDGVTAKIVKINQVANSPVLTLSTNKLKFKGEGERHPLSITSNVAWIATVKSGDETWCSINPNHAESSADVNVTVSATGVGQPRNTTITFTAEGIEPQTLTIEQDALAPKFELSSPVLNFVASGGEKTITITSNVAWTASVESGKTWCTLSSDNGDGSGQVTVNVTASENLDKAVVTFVPAGMQPQNVTVNIEKQIALNASNVSSNNQPSAGYSALFDGGGTGIGGHYQSQWKNPMNVGGVDYPLPPMPHWLTFDLGKNINAFRFQYWTSKDQANSKPAEMEVLISTDNVNWTSLRTYVSTELPITDLGQQFDSDVFTSASPFRYVRLSVSKTIVNKAVTGNSPICIGEIKFFEAPR